MMKLNKCFFMVLFVFLFACNGSNKHDCVLVDVTKVNTAFERILGIDIDSIKSIADKEMNGNTYKLVLADISISADTEFFDKYFDAFFKHNSTESNCDSVLCALTLVMKESVFDEGAKSIQLKEARDELRHFVNSTYSTECIYQSMDFVRMLEKYSSKNIINDYELGYLLIYDYLLHRLTYDCLRTRQW